MMKNRLLLIITFFIFTLLSFNIHKFYVSIYQIDHNIAKKRVEITGRIFIDDLNKVLTKYAGEKTQIGEATETQKDRAIFTRYSNEKMKIIINKRSKTLLFKSTEVVGDQLICYFIIPEIAKIKNIEIQNTALFEIDTQQQNIINININNKKQSLILIVNNPLGMLNF